MEPRYVLDEVQQIVRPDDFFTHAHRIIYQALIEMDAQNIPIDIISLGSHLESQKLLGDIEGRRYLSQLIESFSTTTSAEYHAERINEHAKARNLIDHALRIIDDVSAQKEPVDGLIEKIQNELHTLSQLGSRYDFARFDFAAPDIPRKDWQVQDLIRERDLVLWIGAEKQSKTTLLYQLCVNLASGTDFLGHRVKQPLKVTYLDFETEGEDLQYRLDQYKNILSPSDYARMEENLNVYLLRDKLLKIESEPSLRRGSEGHGLHQASGRIITE